MRKAAALGALGGPHRLARPRTPPFHGGNGGSNPPGDASSFQRILFPLPAGRLSRARFSQTRSSMAIASPNLGHFPWSRLACGTAQTTDDLALKWWSHGLFGPSTGDGMRQVTGSWAFPLRRSAYGEDGSRSLVWKVRFRRGCAGGKPAGNRGANYQHADHFAADSVCPEGHFLGLKLFELVM